MVPRLFFTNGVHLIIIILLQFLALNAEKTTHELINYERSSKISLKGSLGIGILKEASVSISASESIELKSNFGNVNKNEVAVDALSNALQVQARNFNSYQNLFQLLSRC